MDGRDDGQLEKFLCTGKEQLFKSWIFNLPPGETTSLVLVTMVERFNSKCTSGKHDITKV